MFGTPQSLNLNFNKVQVIDAIFREHSESLEIFAPAGRKMYIVHQSVGFLVKILKTPKKSTYQ